MYLPSILLSLLPLAAAKVAPRYGETLETEVLILGGGMAGVSAAHTLYHDLNLTDFLIVEARHELGGRVQNHMVGNTSVEFGANWIQGLGNNPVWKLAQKYGVKNRYSNWSNIDYFSEAGWEGEDGPMQQALTEYEEEVFVRASADAGRRKDLGLADLNMKAGLARNGWKAETPEQKAAEYFSHDWEMAETPLESSFIGTIESYNESFIESGNGDNNIVIDPQGYKQVILKYADEIPDISSKVHLNQIVETITYTSTGVIATTNTGLTIKARRAICTFSVGVLQHTDVIFSPPLPSQKADAIANFHLATYTKIFARFPYKFWNSTEFVLYADPDERGNYPIWQPLDTPGFYPGSGILFATLTGDAAYHAEAQTNEEVAVDLVAVLRRMYGAHVPEPLELKFPRWTRDPLFRGSFTNWGAGVTEQQQEDLRAPIGGDIDSENSLWFAGEHTSRKYFGYLHGAFWEGRLAAMELVDCAERDCLSAEKTALVRREAREVGSAGVAKTVGRLRRRMWA
ncbi:amine oxidase [Geopyxis carbonaria]|nr:amine oxidase [Geopyxis carbonaria]